MKGIAERERIYFEFMFRSNSNFSLANTKRWLRVPIKTNIKSFDHHDFSLAAFVRLICTEECLDNIPETLALDQRRIREMHGLFHELCVLGGSMLLFKQWTEDSYVTPALSQEFKARVTRALAASHFDMDDLARQILLVISRGRKTPIRGINRSILEAMIGNAMSPHHQVFKLIKEQISTIIKRACSVAAMILSNEQEGRLISQTFLNKDDVRRAGLIPMYDELSYVAGKYGTLWALHWKVHSELYTRILT